MIMKRNIIFGCFIIFTMISMISCYDDDSTLPTIDLPEIVVDRSSQGKYLPANFGEKFHYEPKLGKLQENGDTLWLSEEEYNDFNYIWKMSLTASSDTISEVISDQRVLDIDMVADPNSGAGNYALMLQVIHKASGATKQLNWEVRVEGAFTAGLLVADTKDETSSDISLIVTRSYNESEALESYADDKIMRDILSMVNKKKLDGVISDLTYMRYRKDELVTVLIKDKSLVQLEASTMKENARDMQAFIYEPAVYKPEKIFVGNYFNYSMLINDGKVHYYYPKDGGTKYSHTPEFEYVVAPVIVRFSMTGSRMLLFDNKGSKFVAFNNGNTTDIAETEGAAFQANDMPGCELVYGDYAGSMQYLLRCLVKKDGKFYIYELGQQKLDGKFIYDMSGCTDLDKATSYAFSNKYDEFYYAVDNKIYVAILNKSNSFTSKITHEFAAGEKVTHLLMHNGDWGYANGYTTWNENGDGTPMWIESKDNLLTAATYNASCKEGKVYTLPIQYGGSGKFAAEKYINSYGGFGRITAIALR